MPTPISAYQCDFCKTRIYKHRASTVRHESKCPYRQETKACATCDNRTLSIIRAEDKTYRETSICSVYGTDLFDNSNLKMHCEAWVEKTARGGATK